MKFILKISLLIILVSSCSSTKHKAIIPYLLDINVEKSIYEEIIATEHNVVFYIQTFGDSQFKLHLINSNGKEFLSSNRMLFINDKFYPIIFESDYLFYSKIKDEQPIVSIEVERNKYKEIPIPTLEQRIKEPDLYGYPEKTLIIDGSVFWIIDRRGKLVSKNGNVPN